VKAKSEISDGSLLLLVVFLLVNAPNYHISLVLASVVQGDAVNCNSGLTRQFAARIKDYVLSLPPIFTQTQSPCGLWPTLPCAFDALVLAMMRSVAS